MGEHRETKEDCWVQPDQRRKMKGLHQCGRKYVGPFNCLSKSKQQGGDPKNVHENHAETRLLENKNVWMCTKITLRSFVLPENGQLGQDIRVVWQGEDRLKIHNINPITEVNKICIAFLPGVKGKGDIASTIFYPWCTVVTQEQVLQATVKPTLVHRNARRRRVIRRVQ